MGSGANPALIITLPDWGTHEQRREWIGVYGYAVGFGVGVYGDNSSGSGLAGGFNGNIHVTHDITLGGTVMHQSDGNLKQHIATIQCASERSCSSGNLV